MVSHSTCHLTCCFFHHPSPHTPNLPKLLWLYRHYESRMIFWIKSTLSPQLMWISPTWKNKSVHLVISGTLQCMHPKHPKRLLYTDFKTSLTNYFLQSWESCSICHLMPFFISAAKTCHSKCKGIWSLVICNYIFDCEFTTWSLEIIFALALALFS